MGQIHRMGVGRLGGIWIGAFLGLAASACAASATDVPSKAGSPPVAAATSAGDSADPTAPRPTFCVDAAPGLQDVTTTPKGPYFVHHPDASVTAPDTIVFVPGGPGSRDTASITFSRWLSRGGTLGRFRVVVPYAADGDLTDERDRIVPVLDEVLACYGGARDRVHLGGTSNGGVAAFAVILASPDRFRTLLGAPGLFAPNTSDEALTAALAGKAIFNGAGELDTGWKSDVQATNQRLASLGLDTRYVEFAGQGHILDERADQEPFFAFWTSH